MISRAIWILLFLVIEVDQFSKIDTLDFS